MCFSVLFFPRTPSYLQQLRIAQSCLSLSAGAAKNARFIPPPKHTWARRWALGGGQIGGGDSDFPFSSLYVPGGGEASVKWTKKPLNRHFSRQFRTFDGGSIKKISVEKGVNKVCLRRGYSDFAF